MKELLSKAERHLLWRDEIGDNFILLKYAEVYRYSVNVLRLYIFSKKMLLQLRKMGLIWDEHETDDDFYIAGVKAENLARIIALGAFRRRPHIGGRWIKKKEQILGHKILPYRCKKLEGSRETTVLKKKIS